MSKSRKRKEQRKLQRTASIQMPTNKDPSRLRVVIQWCLGIATLVGMLVGLVAFLPRVTVSPITQIDPLKPSPILFAITNTGIIPLDNVQPMMGLCIFRVAREGVRPENLPEGERCNNRREPRFVNKKWFIQRLTNDEPSTMQLEDGLFARITPPAKFGGADIAIIVEYEPWFIPWRREKEFRFVSRVDNEGKFFWTPNPVNK